MGDNPRQQDEKDTPRGQRKIIGLLLSKVYTGAFLWQDYRVYFGLNFTVKPCRIGGLLRPDF